jgi:hypothetical protein
MSYEADLTREQASAGVDVLEQPESAQRGARCRDGKGKPEPRALTKGRHIFDG